jgi:hypothetical protein
MHIPAGLDTGGSMGPIRMFRRLLSESALLDRHKIED